MKLNFPLQHFLHYIGKKLHLVKNPILPSRKRPYFPLPLSILAGTNLIMLLFFIFFATPFDSQENPSLFDFGENLSSFDFRENPCKTPRKTKKIAFFFYAPCAFWIYSRGLFAFVPLDLNFTNPKSTIFEQGLKTQPFPANHDQITK